MITFSRNGTDVMVSITIDVPLDCNRTYTLYFKCGEHNEDYAGFLADAMDKQFRKLVEHMRKSEYNNGWKHAKSHKHAKENWFSGRLP